MSLHVDVAVIREQPGGPPLVAFTAGPELGSAVQVTMTWQAALSVAASLIRAADRASELEGVPAEGFAAQLREVRAKGWGC